MEPVTSVDVHKTTSERFTIEIDIKDEKKKFEHLPEKDFKPRNSILTDLPDDIPNVKNEFYSILVILASLFFGTVGYDYLMSKQLKFGFSLIHAAFGKVEIAILSWILLMLLSCGCYCCFNLWTKVRTALLPQKKIVKIWDTGWTIALVGYFVFCFMLSSNIVSIYQLPSGSASIVLIEQARLLMKVHAFIRTSAEKIRMHKLDSDQELKMPRFSQYFYFLFAPTLIFRTEYPRTMKIRWKFVTCRALELAGAIFYLNFILDRFLIPACIDFGIRKFTRSEIVFLVVKNCLLAIPIYLTGFYLVLHSVQNLFAEILCFGDRVFYKDWWNCTTFSEYFRTWNIIVHDWLYTYLYKDIYEHSIRNKKVAKTITFLVSAVVHEWALTYIFGYFFPGLFIYFMLFLVVIMFETKQQKNQLYNITFNIMFRTGLFIGTGILISCYTLEYFARSNKPNNVSSLGDLLLPKFLTCDCYA